MILIKPVYDVLPPSAIFNSRTPKLYAATQLPYLRHLYRKDWQQTLKKPHDRYVSRFLSLPDTLCFSPTLERGPRPQKARSAMISKDTTTHQNLDKDGRSVTFLPMMRSTLVSVAHCLTLPRLWLETGSTPISRTYADNLFRI